MTESALGPPLTRQLGRQTHSQTVTFESSQLQEGKSSEEGPDLFWESVCQGGLPRGGHMAGASWRLEGILQG